MKVRDVFQSFFIIGVLAALPLTLTACNSLDAEDEAFAEAPPPNAFEVAPVLQNPTIEVWRKGYWAPGEEGHFVWVPGEIIERPAPTAVWSSARWVRHDYGWTFQEGHWE